jgi:uncharacterized protein YcbK (DUF882 family)
MSEDKGLNPKMLTKHFSKREMACPHCQVCLMRDQFMLQLEALRTSMNRALTVSSGYRCPDHNRSIGGAKNSQHLKGNAADISTAGMTEEEIKQLIEIAKTLFTAVVKGPGFVHVDLGPSRSWSYDEKI